MPKAAHHDFADNEAGYSSNNMPVDGYEYDDVYDDDEEYDTAESSFTLASTVHDFSYEHGRRYASYRSGNNPFPFDELSKKNERIFYHVMLCLLDNKFYAAPIEHPKAILDVRCGLGLWAENVAEMHEDAEVVAMDTTARESPTIMNLEFLVQNFDDEWILNYPDQKFDFIYGRLLYGQTSNFPRYYQQAFDNLRPGGYLEQHEVLIMAKCDDGTERPNSVIRQLTDTVSNMSSASGTEYHIAMIMQDMIKAAGFVDVVEKKFQCPLGPWRRDQKGRTVGEYFEAFYKSGIQGWLMATYTKHMGYTPDQVNELCEKAFQEVDARDQHWYFETVVIYARKPE